MIKTLALTAAVIFAVALAPAAYAADQTPAAKSDVYKADKAQEKKDLATDKAAAKKDAASDKAKSDKDQKADKAKTKKDFDAK